jgi:hypothetical protein
VHDALLESDGAPPVGWAVGAPLAVGAGVAALGAWVGAGVAGLGVGVGVGFGVGVAGISTSTV